MAVAIVLGGTTEIEAQILSEASTTPPHIMAIENWADSLSMEPNLVPRLQHFSGSPARVTVQKYRTKGPWPDEFDPAKPFNGLTEELESKSMLRMDRSGRITSSRVWEPWVRDESFHLDSLEYGPQGIVHWLKEFGDFSSQGRQVTWEDGRLVLAEWIVYGFPTTREVMHYEESPLVIEWVYTNMYSPDTTRWRKEFNSNGKIGRMTRSDGRDSSLAVYQYFKDSSCVLGWSTTDTTARADGELWYLRGRSLKKRSGGREIETIYGRDKKKAETIVRIDQRIMRSTIENSVTEAEYDVHGSLTRLVDHMTFPGLRSNTYEYRYYYQYDAVGNPIAILHAFVSGHERGSLYFEFKEMWRLDYDYW